MSGAPAVFLDRDGVLNSVVWRDGKAASPRSLEELVIEPGVIRALGRLRAMGYHLFAVTNQPDVSRGKMSAKALQQIHDNLAQRMPLDEISACVHDNADNCACRKPKPGLILDLAERWNIDLSRSWMVGDQDRDIASAHAANCRAVLLARPYNSGGGAEFVVDNLLQAVDVMTLETPPAANQDASPMFSDHFFDAAGRAMAAIDRNAVEAMALALADVRNRGGRLFLIGVGGSAGHASHATNDFRKICGFEAYCPTDNVSELTARINDEGWEGTFSTWLESSRLKAEDGLLIFSVGGGSLEPPVSANIVRAVQLAKTRGATVTGIVGRQGGYTAQVADACVIVPTVDSQLITPLVEGLAAVVWHLLVSHPALAMSKGHWEQITNPAPVAAE